MYAPQIDRKIAGWDHLCRRLEAMRDEARAESLRLLGPERGE